MLRRALIVTDRIPTPLKDGGSLRTCELLALFQTLGFDVTLVTLRPESWPPFDLSLSSDRAALAAKGVRLPNESADQHLQTAGAAYELILFSGLYVADRLLRLARSVAPETRLVYDTVDLHHLREFREAKLAGNAKMLGRALETKQREFALAQAADAVFVVSSYEQEMLGKELPQVRCCLVPNVHRVRQAEFTAQGRKDLLFVGMFQHSPNIDAALFLGNEIFPLLRAKRPEVNLHLIGADPPPLVRALAGAGIEVPGFVKDLAPYWQSCLASVAPLRFGAGVKGKVLESMAQGLPVVASSIAAEGMAVRHEENILIADEPADFVRQLLRLAADEGLWTKLAHAGQQVVVEKFSPAVVGQQLAESLAEVWR